MLGAVTGAGDRFVYLTPDRFNSVVALRFLRALQSEFGEKLVILLDNAPYFIAEELQKQATAAGLLLEFSRPHSHELDPGNRAGSNLELGGLIGCSSPPVTSRNT